METKYAFVNEKIVDGKLYRAFRSIEDPKDCLITIDDKEIKVKTLKNYWLIKE